MPIPKVDVTCENCWWHGRRHPDHWDDFDCPHCGEHVLLCARQLTFSLTNESSRMGIIEVPLAGGGGTGVEAELKNLRR